MFKLDDNLLKELGLGTLPPAEKNRMLSHIYETLEMRVGMKLAQKMTNEQLDEFESFIDRNDEAGALKWLETNFPDYKQVVAEELEKLKGEIKAAAPQIIAESMQQQAIGQMPPQTPTQAPMGASPMPPQPQYTQPVQPFGTNPAQQPYQQPQPYAAPPQQPYVQPTPMQQPPQYPQPQFPPQQPPTVQ